MLLFMNKSHALQSYIGDYYMFSKLSILLFVFPFLTSRNVLYLSCPRLRLSLHTQKIGWSYK